MTIESIKKLSACQIAWLIVVVFPLIASGQSEEELRQCSTIENVLARVECYDALVRALDDSPPLPEVPESVVVTETDKWIVTANPEAGRGETRASVSIQADSGVSGDGVPVSMVIRCRGETELYIRWHENLGSWAHIATRLGGGNRGQRRWNLSTNGQITFYPGLTVDFVERLMEVDQFSAEVTPFGGAPITALFDVRGLSEVVKPLREACDW